MAVNHIAWFSNYLLILLNAHSSSVCLGLYVLPCSILFLSFLFFCFPFRSYMQTIVKCLSKFSQFRSQSLLSPHTGAKAGAPSRNPVTSSCNSFLFTFSLLPRRATLMVGEFDPVGFPSPFSPFSQPCHPISRNLSLSLQVYFTE